MLESGIDAWPKESAWKPLWLRRFQNTNTSDLRFSALLTDGAREVRIERVVGG